MEAQAVTSDVSALEELDLQEGDKVRCTWSNYHYANIREGMVFNVVKKNDGFFIKVDDYYMLPMKKRSSFVKVK